MKDLVNTGSLTVVFNRALEELSRYDERDRLVAFVGWCLTRQFSLSEITSFIMDRGVSEVIGFRRVGKKPEAEGIVRGVQEERLRVYHEGLDHDIALSDALRGYTEIYRIALETGRVNTAIKALDRILEVRGYGFKKGSPFVQVNVAQVSDGGAGGESGEVKQIVDVESIPLNQQIDTVLRVAKRLEEGLRDGDERRASVRGFGVEVDDGEGVSGGSGDPSGDGGGDTASR